MTHNVIFYPVGDGDTSQIILNNGKRILMDYHHLTKAEDDKGPEINLAKRLRQELKDAKRDYMDVVAFTHGDEDHIKGAKDFFELQHAAQFQGGDRIKINELWVPAALLCEEFGRDEIDTDRCRLQKEARHRLRKGAGIRVFSRPDLLKDWMKKNDIDFEARKHLFVDAGTLVPGFTLADDGVEFFVHSPFVEHTDEGDDLRNSCAIILNVRFSVNGQQTDYLAIGDTDCHVLEDIVRISEYHGNLDRLNWDLFNIPHHCSYKALSEDKGDRETDPIARVKQLLLRGQRGSYLVSSSNPILNNKEAYEQKMPPHIQAKNAYETYLKKVNGKQFLVTMQEPNGHRPEPLTFEIGAGGCVWKKSAKAGAAAIVASTPPRAG